MKDNPNIDELLNGFIDDELTERQRVEVQRLISDDAQVAQRLRELERCKMLVGSLPRAAAPAEMAEQIKASLETEVPSGRQVVRFDERRGMRHLLARRVLAMAAMIGLVAVLTVVLYTAIGPEGVTPAVGFRGRLELKTSDLAAVDTFIKKAIEDRGLSKDSTLSRQEDKRVYSLACSREALDLLLADLGGVWERFDSTRLVVETQTPGGQVTVEDVNAKQIADLITPPKPRLTGDEKATDKPVNRAREVGKAELTIVVVSGQ